MAEIVKTFEDARVADILPDDHITRTYTRVVDGVTFVTRREGIATHQNEGGEWCTKEGGWLTLRNDDDYDTTVIMVTRAVKELPTTVGTVLVPINPDEPIEAVIAGTKYYTNEAVYGPDGKWHGLFRSDTTVLGFTWSEYITPGKWKIEEKR